MALARAAVGLWLPANIRSQFDRVAKAEEPMDHECAICLEHVGESSAPTTLYCGHLFCQDCIKGYATSADVPTCPLCRRQLCLELLPRAPDAQQITGEPFGGMKRMGFDPSNRGPTVLTKVQLVTECVQRWKSEKNKTKIDLATLQQGLAGGGLEGSLELGASVTVQVGPVDGGMLCISPKLGPVVIPIVIKSIPVLASVSTTSLYTTVGKDS
eukprot:m.246442 g.246442  ORF g.246442 m.246442 type:complete len:213 (-) comp33847_c2_seq22:1428-2066(-)